MKINWKALGSVLWHGGRIALDAAQVLEQSGVLKVSPKAQTAFWVAAAIEHAAQGQQIGLIGTTASQMSQGPVSTFPQHGTTGE